MTQYPTTVEAATFPTAQLPAVSIHQCPVCKQPNALGRFDCGEVGCLERLAIWDPAESEEAL